METPLSSGLELILPQGRSDLFRSLSLLILGKLFVVFFGGLSEEKGNCTQHLKQQNVFSFYSTKLTVNKSNYVYDLLKAPLMS